MSRPVRGKEGPDVEIPVKVVVHKSRSAGGFWAEVPALPGCVSEGETLEELRANIREAIECWMGVGQEFAKRIIAKREGTATTN